MGDLIENTSNSRSRAVQWIAQTIGFSIYIAGLGRLFNSGNFILLFYSANEMVVLIFVHILVV